MYIINGPDVFIAIFTTNVGLSLCVISSRCMTVLTVFVVVVDVVAVIVALV